MTWPQFHGLSYPYLWPDAKIEKVRGADHQVRNKALVVAYGVHETGRREVIGIAVGEAETEAFWMEFMRDLRDRGLTGAKLCVSDDHIGPRRPRRQASLRRARPRSFGGQTLRESYRLLSSL